MEKRIFKIRTKVFSKDQRKSIDAVYDVFDEYKVQGETNAEYMCDMVSNVMGDIVESFISFKGTPVPKELDAMEKALKIMQYSYSIGYSLVSDIIYDKAVTKFSQYRAVPIVEIIPKVIDQGRLLKDKDHNYDNLKGSLKKATTIYNNDEGDESLETFITKCLSVVEPGEPLKLSHTYKFDGVSGVGTFTDTGLVESLITRGEDGKGGDITHLMRAKQSHYILYAATIKPDGEKVGVQFEICMTHVNKKKYEKMKGKTYANCRSAVVSIVTASEGAKYAQFLSFVPLRISNGRDHAWMERVFGSDIENDELSTVYINRPVSEILANEECFIENIYQNREKGTLPCDIDGVVIECTNEEVIEKLGRTHNINNFMIAYKFKADSAITKVTDMTYSVGRTGLIIPMVHYNQVVFAGTKHVKSTLSSNKRFKEMALREGSLVNITYNHEVMPYVNTHICDENSSNMNDLYEMPTHCDCGTTLQEVGANLYCLNTNCVHKMMPAFEHFYKKLGVRDLSIKTIEKLYSEGILLTYYDLLSINMSKVALLDGFKEKKIKNIKKELDKVRNSRIPTSKIIAALGIEGERKSKAILSHITLKSIMQAPSQLINMDIPQIKDKTKLPFIDKISSMIEIINYYLDILDVYDDMVAPAKETASGIGAGIEVAFTGFRSADLSAILIQNGYTVVDKCKKTTGLLIVKDAGSESSSVKKAEKWGIDIKTYDEILGQLVNKVKK